MTIQDNNPETGTNRTGPEFRGTIFHELDSRLRQSPWKSGAAEAHGLLSALACCGVRAEEIRARSWLFNLREESHLDILDGLYGLICRDLDDPDCTYALLLPPDESGLADRAEALADWCQGFLQGMYHRDGALPADSSEQVIEAVEDIREIGHLELDPQDPEGCDRALAEVEEYLRVAVLLIRDELQPVVAGPRSTTTLN
jgi:uncharacterized protein YgfB (UPF0149 family)